MERQPNRKKYPYYGKSMGTNFPGSSHTMGFVGFYTENNQISQAFSFDGFDCI